LLLRIVLHGRLEGKKAVGRAGLTTLDWLMDKQSRVTYRKVKDKA